MRICNRCLMDTSDPNIVFDEHGICNHCHTYDQKIQEYVVTGSEGRRVAHNVMATITKNMSGAKYNCIIGISGGVDSSYLAYVVKMQYKMNPIAVHFDNGWNTPESVSNVKTILDKLGIDLYTYVIDWDEFKDLQLSFIKSGTPDLEIPTDHAIVAILNKVALDLGIPYIISGANVRTESHVPAAWSQGHWDWKYVQSVHRQFGKIPLNTFPLMSIMDLLRVKWVRLLNYLDYDKDAAKSFLIKEMGWKDYGWKHHESIYTRFYQGYILPTRWGYDKKKSHLSSLICSGCLSRGEAVRMMLTGDSYSYNQMQTDRRYVIKKLGINDDKFQQYMNMPRKTYEDYPNIRWILRSDWFQKIYQQRTTIKVTG
jgi:N-acetyl sugar amidotransferase